MAGLTLERLIVRYEKWAEARELLLDVLYVLRRVQSNRTPDTLLPREPKHRLTDRRAAA